MVQPPTSLATFIPKIVIMKEKNTKILVFIIFEHLVTVLESSHTLFQLALITALYGNTSIFLILQIRKLRLRDTNLAKIAQLANVYLVLDPDFLPLIQTSLYLQNTLESTKHVYFYMCISSFNLYQNLFYNKKVEA